MGLAIRILENPGMTTPLTLVARLSAKKNAKALAS
jgi:hypothetical protein